MSDPQDLLRHSARSRYWLALGQFIDVFASTEAALLNTLRMVCGLEFDLASKLFANMRAKDAITTIRQILSGEQMPRYEEVLVQIAYINDARNMIVHRGAQRASGTDATFKVSNWLIRRPSGALEEFEVTPEVLSDMTRDLLKAQFMLLYQQKDRWPGGMSPALLDDCEEAILQPWLYKPQQLALGPAKTRAKPPSG